MELLATNRRDRQRVACAYGASLNDSGTRLTCGLLFVMRRQSRAVIVLQCSQTKTRLRVRLPKMLLGAKGHALAKNITLEVVP
ncbi:hypothetical protein [Deinococcus sp. PEB2-63]